ncbi:MAG: hypothetical protein RSA97_06900 [Oscillospiraceae bacterium]
MSKKLSVYEIASVGVSAAMLLGVQIVLAPLPNIELVSLLVICFTKAFGRRALYIIYTFALLEGLVYGFGIWFLTYLYVWTVLYLVVRVLSELDNSLVWAIIAAIYGISFGTLTSIPYFFIGGFSGGIAYIVSGAMFDLLHCAGNFVSVLILYRPVIHVLNKVESVSARTVSRRAH